tara:strand:- start:3648 stop:3827 length:180 start_codon:yes stop_codon:yes gene_type:complete
MTINSPNQNQSNKLSSLNAMNSLLHNAGNSGERKRVRQPKAAYCLPLLLVRLDELVTEL